MDQQFLIEVAVAVLLVGMGMAPWLLPRLDGRAQNPASYHRAWNDLASRAGLKFDLGPRAGATSVAGQYRGRTLTLNLLVDRRAAASVSTRVILTLTSPLPGNLTVRETRRLERWRRRLLRQPEGVLGQRFALSSQPPSLAGFLGASPAWRRKLSQAGPVSIHLADGQLFMLHAGIVMDAENLLFLFDVLSDAARLLERARDEEAPQ